MSYQWVIVLLIIVGVGLAYNVARDLTSSTTDWWNVQLNGPEYCPDGDIETVSLAVQGNGIGAEYTRTVDGKFCFRTKDSVLAGNIIKDVQDRKKANMELEIKEREETKRLGLILLSVIIVIVIIAGVIIAISSSGGSL